MSADAPSHDCVITARRDWAPHLFSFRVARPDGIAFVPGQFVRLGLEANDGTTVWRAYSIASAPDDPGLEFYSIVVADGPFTQALAARAIGDTVRVAPTVYGFLRADRFVGGRHLWLLATGTGIAPFHAMLADPAVWRRFDDIVLVHSVRQARELAYRDAVEAWVERPPFDGARLRYLPTLTGASGDVGIGRGRITTRLADGTLERDAGLRLTVDDARLMICCNPSMIRETRALLGTRGLAPVRRDVPGQYIAENFW